MSTYKTSIEKEVVLSFLQKKDDSARDLAFIAGGEGSQAFSYESDAGRYIIRINTNSEGFEKDKYAYEHFCSSTVPIPAILEIGKLNDDFTFATSEHATGTRVDLLPEEKRAAVVPELFRTLDAIHATDITGTSGYGKFNAEGKAEYPSWRASFSALDTWRAVMMEKPEAFPMQVEGTVWSEVRKEIERLLPYCPEERSLLHGDFGFDNAFSDGKKITAVIDWGNAGYGDFLHDAAWLGYWSRYHTERIDPKAYYAAQKIEVPHFDERMRCYELQIGLGGLMFYAYSQQRDKYDYNKKILLTLLAE